MALGWAAFPSDPDPCRMNTKTRLYTSEQNCDLTGCEVILLYYSGCGPTAHVFSVRNVSAEL